jgi:septum formation protein
VRIVLASASPRRREFLANLGLRFEAAAPKLDETRLAGEAPQAYVERLAREKAAAFAAPGAIALGADTSVVVGDHVLGKPLDQGEAVRMLRLLSGAWHVVITAVCVTTSPSRDSAAAVEVRSVQTRVKFAEMSEAQIAWLARSGDGDDKAGAYAIQGLAGAFVERIEGSFSNVVGLPLTETLQLLAKAGAELPWT